MAQQSTTGGRVGSEDRNSPKPAKPANRRCKLSHGASMTLSSSSRVGLCFLMTSLMLGCGKFGTGSEAAIADGAPDEEQLQKINYMSSSDSGVKGRKVYDHLQEARTCSDFELAMRWNR